MKSRLTKYFRFPDYSESELERIFLKLCKDYDYTLTDGAKAYIKYCIKELSNNRGHNFANARSVRSLFEKVITNQANRITSIGDLNNTDVTEIVDSDFIGL